ncbi:uncharacterized protein iapp [Brachyhypopomus gauderio]|uniref:uncharacterized protein iapp n=1 Tax=Brachyhypopomus gauderio TaxID=698409 RepID=UPI004042FAD8
MSQVVEGAYNKLGRHRGRHQYRLLPNAAAGPKLLKSHGSRLCAMDHLTVPVLLFLFPALLLQDVASAPSNRYLISFSEQADDSPEEKGWMASGLSTTPFMRFPVSRPQRAISAVSSHQHHIEKRKCNTATCVTQRLADFLIRSSNAMGTVYAPTNVGSSTYGKRDLLQVPNSLLL